MPLTVNLSTGLRSWIIDNLHHGTPPAVLVDELVSRRFDRDIACGLIDAFVSARAASRPPPEHQVRLDSSAPPYQYEKPRIAPGNVIDAGGREVRVLHRLAQPTVVTLENVLSVEECERLIALAAPRLARSTVVDPATGTNAVADYRNSEGMFFHLRENTFIREIDERISALMSFPVENGEGLQVLRYSNGGYTAPHFDFLIPSNAHNSDSLARSGQRVSTLIVYLNDVPEGGETIFPHAGLCVVPRRGHALYFEYANSRMQVDQLSLHAGAPVTLGEKWVATKWMRERRFVSKATVPRPAG